MKYAQQTQDALDRLDQSLATLRDLIKRGEQAKAIDFMEQGELKDRFDELQIIVTLSSTGDLGASGVSSVGAL